ncbi:MAG TPA: TSUP family transporter, partial [Egibacteraceae bacterium]|nr:TSUP family transporter [Egibacteraceae bacterium]
MLLVELALGFAVGCVISVVTSPIGVSGAMFLLPVQLSVLGVPSPAVTPTNLLFNVVAVPGALERYRRLGTAPSPLTRRLLLGTVPGVVVGAIVRVLVLPGDTAFRLVVAAVLAPLGAWLITNRGVSNRRLSPPAVTAMAAGAGLIGGVYGLGGGSLLAPVLVGSGYLVSDVAAATLRATWVTSLAGAAVYAAIEATTGAAAGPVWHLGLAFGLGG